MRRRAVLAGIAATVGSLAQVRSLRAQNATPLAGETRAMQSGYAPVNGLQLYYEIHGDGEPLILLHGAYATTSMWGPILELLAQKHRVISVDLQGHGRTADIDRPIRYEAMADDVAALMDYLDIASADTFGYSMGGGVALQLALRHPERVRRQVLAAASYRHDGMYPEVLAGIAEITPEAFAGTPMESVYLAEAPNPENWPVLIEKLKDLDAQEFHWDEDAIRAIASPTFLIFGDGDVVTPEHAVEMFRLFGGGVPADLTGLPASRLAILPGTTHVTLVLEQQERLIGMVEDFLAQPID
ncbi:MAG: alpha/beta fold hydrolase [Thermomicrobiales bacterium]|nr:alpha/beta fold hydrolase [Thermomicrobiales bacterium]